MRGNTYSNLLKGSSRVYRILGRTVVAYPLVFDVSDFYMSSDTDSLIDNVWFSLDFLKKYFEPSQQPVFLFILREDMCKGPRLKPMLEVLSCFRRGVWRDVKIRLGRLQSFVANADQIDLSFVRELPEANTSSPIIGEEVDLSRSNSISSLQSTPLPIEDDFTVNEHKIKIIEKVRDTSGLIDLYFDSSSFVEKAHILIRLQQMHGNEFIIGDNIKVGTKLNFILRQFTKQKDWAHVRLVASHCKKLVDSLAPSVTTILCEGKQLSIGVFGHKEITITSPLNPKQISDILYTTVFEVNPSEAVLQQELILTIGQRIMVSQPHLMDRILNVRIGWLVEAMRIEHSNQDIFKLSPSEIKAALEKILKTSANESGEPCRSRRLEGALNKAPRDFYDHVWLILERSTQAGIKIRGNIISSQPTLSDMDSTDIGFKLMVEEVLQKIKIPEERHLVIETLIIISTILFRNPELNFNSFADVDAILIEATQNYEKSADKTDDFYFLESAKVVKYISHSVIKTILSTGEIDLPINSNCKIS